MADPADAPSTAPGEGARTVRSLDPTRMPAHVAIIMDGNGRWANARGLPRTAGHAAGEEALFDTVEGALEIGLPWLTVYAFSTENWNRPPEEVEFLMFFNRDLLIRRREELRHRGVRFHFIGELADPRIPDENRRLMAETAQMTASNDRLHLVFAFNYGGRAEIATAARRLAAAAADGELDPAEIGIDAVARSLYLPEMPDPDLVIRTSGELRLSNFLLWEAAYAELAFPEILWPDFRRHHLVEAIVDYQRRHRRFGGVEGPS